jgi:hypothetical protein
MGKGVRAALTKDRKPYRLTGRYSNTYLDPSATCISYLCSVPVKRVKDV